MPEGDAPEAARCSARASARSAPRARSTTSTRCSTGVDGALLVGPVFKNHIHNAVTADRDAGSPFWRPVYKHGEHVRFAVTPSDLAQPADRVEAAARRLSAELDRPDHVLEASTCSGSSPSGSTIRAAPTSRRTCSGRRSSRSGRRLGDMVFSTGVPAGHGHDYGVNPVDAWAAITQPPGWTDGEDAGAAQDHRRADVGVTPRRRRPT